MFPACCNIFWDQSRTWEVLYMSHTFSAFHPRVLFQREMSIQRKWIVQLVHPLWNTHTAHAPTSRGNLREGRTDQKSEHLHTSIYFIFVSRRCDGHFHFQCVWIALNASKIYTMRCLSDSQFHQQKCMVEVRRSSTSERIALPVSKAVVELASIFCWHQQLSIRSAAGKTNMLATFIPFWHLASGLGLWMKRRGSINPRWFHLRTMQNE